MNNIEINRAGTFDAAVAELSSQVTTPLGRWVPWEDLQPIAADIVAKVDGTEHPDGSRVEALGDAAKLRDLWIGITDRCPSKKFDAVVKKLSPHVADGNGVQKSWDEIRPMAIELVARADDGCADLWRIDALMGAARLRSEWGN